MEVDPTAGSHSVNQPRQPKAYDLVINGKVGFGWRIDNLNSDRAGVSFLMSPFALVRESDDAAKVCTAVNSYDALLEASNGLLDALDYWKSDASAWPCCFPVEKIEALRAAIAKAVRA